MHTREHRETERPRWFWRRRRLTPAPKQLWSLPFLLLILLSQLVHAQDGSGLLLGAGDQWRPGLIMDTDVELHVRGLIAEVRLRQRFRNDSGQWQEGRYLLPLPENAAVDALTVRIGDRLIEGEIREKAEARKVYEQAAARGQRAGLVEQNRPNLFRTAIANIAPDEEVEVELRYWQPVDFRDGVFALGLPLTLTPRYTPGSCEGCDVPAESLPAAQATSEGFALALPPTVALRAVIDAGLSLQRVYSPSHAVSVHGHGEHWQVELAELVEASDRDFLLRWEPVPSAAPRSAVFTEQRDGEHFALLMLVPPTLPSAPLPRELILVIDNSGSMLGESMDQAKAAADRALARLRPGDRFNVIRFDHTLEALHPQSVTAEPGAIAHARMFVRGLQAEGGTELLPALRRAFEGQAPQGLLRQVVLATDAAIGNEEQVLRAIEQERGNARLFPVGIGSAPNGHFLRKSAELGRGSQLLIRDIGEVAERMDELLARLDRPAMRDIRVDWPGVADGYPQQVPDLYQGEALQVVAKLAQPAGTAHVSGLAPQPWTRPLALQRKQGHDSPGVARLWARARIESLEDAMRRGADEAEIRPQILDTALRHQLLSRYTSLVVVERSPARPTHEGLASTQIANATPAGSLAFAQGSTGWPLELLLAAALGLIATVLIRRS